jgi:cell division control protein 24
MEMESFSLKCRNEEQLNQWQSTLEKLLADIQNRQKDESSTPTVKRTQVSNTQLASLQNLELPVYSRRDDDAASFIDEDEDEDDYEDEDDDWEHNKPKSQSLPYGQYPASGYNGRIRPRTEDGSAPPPYNWNSSSPPLPPSIPPQHRHANASMPPLPRNGMTTAPPTMATFPSNVMHHQGENTGYFPNSPPPSYPGSPSQSVRSSASTSSHTWQRRSIEKSSPLADTIAKFLMGNDDEVSGPTMQRAHSHSAASGQTFQQANGPTPVMQQTSTSNPSNLNRLRSASSPNIHAIQEAQWENSDSLPDLPKNNDEQRHSGSSTSSQTGTNAPVSNGLSPTNGVANGNQYNYSVTMKIKVNYAEDIFVIVVPQNIEYKELCDRVERKIRLCTTQRNESIPLRIKYQDEDGDHITINSDEDVLMAFEGRLAAGGNFVNLYVS